MLEVPADQVKAISVLNDSTTYGSVDKKDDAESYAESESNTESEEEMVDLGGWEEEDEMIGHRVR